MIGKTSGPEGPPQTSNELPDGPDLVQAPINLPSLPDTECGLWIVLKWRSVYSPQCFPSQIRLQEDLGRTGKDRRHLTKLTAALEAAGWLKVRRIHREGKTRNFYEPLGGVIEGDGQGWVDLPRILIDEMRAGRIGPEVLVAAWRWLGECRTAGGGWTQLAVAQAARQWGQAASTVRTHRSKLIALGVLEECQQPGKAPITAAPGRLPEWAQCAGEQEAEETPTPPVEHTSPHRQKAHDPADRSHTELPHWNYPIGTTPALVPVGTNVTAVDARRRAPTASPKTRDPLHQVHPSRTRHSVPPSSPSAWATIAKLPRPWRDCKRWVLRRLAERLDRAIFIEGCGPDAIANAVVRYSPTPYVLATNGGPLRECDAERHTRALDAVLVLLVADIKAGHCPDCGHHHHDAVDHTCRCCTVDAGEWLTVQAGRCVSCDGGSATVREGLPLGSAVCDPCWSTELVAA